MPKWELVTERLLHEETKLKEKTPAHGRGEEGRKALVTGQKRQPKGNSLVFIVTSQVTSRESVESTLQLYGKKEPALLQQEVQMTQKPW